MVPNIEKLFET